MSKWTDDDWKKLYDNRVGRFTRLQQLKAPTFILAQEAYLILQALQRGKIKTFRWIFKKEVQDVIQKLRFIPLDIWCWWGIRQGRIVQMPDGLHMKDCPIYQAFCAGKPFPADEDVDDTCFEDAMPWWTGWKVKQNP